jgi:hypothetical protein
MSKARGAIGKARPRPRQPTPAPRRFKIRFTDHARQRCNVDRGIPESLVEETIVQGREITSDETGLQGGYISRFEKNIVTHAAGLPLSRQIIAVCEILPDRCVVMTAYYG